MKIINRTRYGIFGVALCGFLLAGCQSQYKQVAKEYCTAIRACQMVPVYPLSQDVRPGDVFLVQRPISEQHREYKRWGFLALDDQRMRLQLEPSSFGNMYFDSYFKNEIAPPCPYPTIASADTSVISAGTNQVQTSLTTTQVSRVAFPTYSFGIKRGEGLSLGVPISSIPVALNFLGAQKTTASVTLANASSYQADHETIMKKLRDWVEGPDVNNELKAACDYMEKDYVFLRVIKRVYLVGAVDITLENNDEYKGNVQVGIVEQVADSEISTETFTSNSLKQATLIKTLNDMAASNKIGGAVNFNTATRRTVGLRESFDRPLVVGYLGIDVPFFKDGTLGAPIPTFGHISGLDCYRDPKPMELEKLLAATSLLRDASKHLETRYKAIVAAEDFCGEFGADFKILVEQVSQIKSKLDKNPNTNALDDDINKFMNALIDNINFLASVGNGKAKKRQGYERALQKALNKQGL